MQSLATPRSAVTVRAAAQGLVDAVKASVRTIAAPLAGRPTGTSPRALAHPASHPATNAAEPPRCETWTHAELAARALRRIEAGADGLRLSVSAGEVWLTRSVEALPPPPGLAALAWAGLDLPAPDLAASGEADLWLSAGQSLVLPPHSRWLLQAWSAASLTLRATPTAAPAAAHRAAARQAQADTLCGAGLR